MQMTLPKSQKQRGTKEPLDEGEEKSKKAGLKLNIQKTKIMASSPITSWQISSFQFSCSVVSASLRPHGPQHTRPPCPSPKPWSLLKLMSIELVMPSNQLILFRPLLFLPSIFPSIRVFSNESAFCIRWPKYWSFSLNNSPSNEYSGLISFRKSWQIDGVEDGSCNRVYFLRLQNHCRW